MALQHAEPGQPWDVSPLGSALSSSQSTALFKSAELEVIRLVLLAGKSLPPHKVTGAITVLCIEGALVFEAQGSRRRLRAGQILYLPGGEPHAVSAEQDSSALLTIVLDGTSGDTPG
ncbi:MAG: cupin domain-containing protein [Proteobacteria bacterium]|nr:cupin domain-containing protein [Pseudomonadota bacterium]